MASSRIERFKARMKNMNESTKKIGLGVLRSGETLVAGSGMAYLEGRMSDDTGDWGFRGVPYAWMGGAVLILGGLYAGYQRSEASGDLFALGTGVVGANLFRKTYELGLEAKNNRTTGGKSLGRGRVPMGMGAKRPNGATQFGTVFDNAGVAR
jgi:hypothetical protein